jgi:hypothetical protein
MGAAMSAAASAGAPPAARGAARHVFVVEVGEAPDALLRVLGVFAVQGTRVAALSFGGTGSRSTARLEVDGLDAQRAEHVRRRLSQLPAVANVAFGWRT